MTAGPTLDGREAEPSPTHVRVVSADGLVHNTRISIGDFEPCVTKAVITIDPREGFVTAHLELDEVDLLISEAHLIGSVNGSPLHKILVDALATADNSRCSHAGGTLGPLCRPCVGQHLVDALIRSRNG